MIRTLLAVVFPVTTLRVGCFLLDCFDFEVKDCVALDLLVLRTDTVDTGDVVFLVFCSLVDLRGDVLLLGALGFEICVDFEVDVTEVLVGFCDDESESLLADCTINFLI